MRVKARWAAAVVLIVCGGIYFVVLDVGSRKDGVYLAVSALGMGFL